jgi:hypothetical protein
MPRLKPNKKPAFKRVCEMFWYFLILVIGGAGGNRTPVRKPSTDSSTYLAVLFIFNRTLTNEQASAKRVALDLMRD